MNKLFRNRGAGGIYYRRFVLPEKVIKGSCSTVDWKHTWRISVLDAERVYACLPVFRNHLRDVECLT
jgi:hypothetical protein